MPKIKRPTYGSYSRPRTNRSTDYDPLANIAFEKTKKIVFQKAIEKAKKKKFTGIPYKTHGADGSNLYSTLQHQFYYGKDWNWRKKYAPHAFNWRGYEQNKLVFTNEGKVPLEYWIKKNDWNYEHHDQSIRARQAVADGLLTKEQLISIDKPVNHWRGDSNWQENYGHSLKSYKKRFGFTTG